MGIVTICPHCDLRFDTGLEDCWGMDVAQCPACNRRFVIGNGLTRSLTYNVSIPPMRCPIHQYRPELIVKDAAGRELRLDDYEAGHEDGESLDGYLDRVGVDFCVWCPYCTVGEPMYASSKESLEDAYEKWNDKVNGEREIWMRSRLRR